MICFQDRTFCGDAGCNGACGFDPWTAELQARADRWWAGMEGPAPVCFIIHKGSKDGEGEG